MKQRIEHENKYTVTSLPNKDYWDRHVLVYQFILEINNNESKQLKMYHAHFIGHIKTV